MRTQLASSWFLIQSIRAAAFTTAPRWAAPNPCKPQTKSSPQQSRQEKTRQNRQFPTDYRKYHHVANMQCRTKPDNTGQYRTIPDTFSRISMQHTDNSRHFVRNKQDKRTVKPIRTRSLIDLLRNWLHDQQASEL